MGKTILPALGERSERRQEGRARPREEVPGKRVWARGVRALISGRAWILQGWGNIPVGPGAGLGGWGTRPPGDKGKGSAHINYPALLEAEDVPGTHSSLRLEAAQAHSR